MRISLSGQDSRAVALRKESVDRNRYLGIETDPLDWVALRKESVDRNVACGEHIRQTTGRSPQGERG